MQWDNDAAQMMRVYLEDVRRASVARGANGDGVVERVEARIVEHLRQAGADVVTAELLREMLAKAGPPESVAAAVTPPPLPPGGTVPPPVSAGPAEVAPPRPSNKSNTTVVTCLVVGAVAMAGIMILGLLAAILLPALARAREAARRASCQNNMKQVQLLCAIHAEDNQSAFPLPSLDGDVFMFDPAVMDGEPMDLLQCPSDPKDAAAAGPDYIYLGYAIRNQADANAVIQHYLRALANPRGVALPDAIPGPSGAIPRLRNGMAEAGQIPVLVEWVGYHIPDGANVVYLDGHSEYIRFNAKFPVTEEFYAAANQVW